jgi:hypothetical protein
MYINILTSLPAIGSAINSIVKAFKNDGKISLEEAGDISKELLEVIIGLGIPGLNSAKFVKYAPKLIVYIVEIIKQDVSEYKKTLNSKDKELTVAVNQQFYQIGNDYRYDGVPREDIVVQSTLDYED